MPKGPFSQGFALLTNSRARLDNVKQALQEQGFEIVKEVPQEGRWQFSGPALIVPFRPEANGYVAVDLVERCWPDAMGDIKADAQTFAAWSMGQFGPFAYPGSLARAGEHSWAWDGGRSIAQKHQGFIRLRLSYSFGASDDAPVMPSDCDPLAELFFLGRMVLPLLAVPGVICYFNPNGEVLRHRMGYRPIWKACEHEQKPPLPLWMNIRFFNLSPTLGMMDTVGNAQIDLPDVQAIFPLDRYAPQEVDYYLRNVTHYLMDRDGELHSGEAIDGPGESNASWITEVPERQISEPPRQVLRLYPKANQKAIDAALDAAAGQRQHQLHAKG